MTAKLPGLRHPCIFALALALLSAVSTLRADDDASPNVPPTMLSGDAKAEVNASARGLGGISGPGGGAWEGTSVWRSYEKWIDFHWKYLERVRLTAMNSWSASELGGLRGSRAVFYPFSGPDFLYVDTMLPGAKYLLMAGLEPVGTMPDLAKLQDDDRLAPYIGQVQTSLNTILVASFFKTKDMKVDFNNQSVDGLMPVIVAFLARQGCTIDAIDYVSLGHDGTLHRRGEGGGASGVQIAYDRGGDLQYLFYFATNLADDGLAENPGYIKLMKRLAPGVTYLKAASYLLYDSYFSTMRDAILEDSSAVVEDDSGIPFRDFNPKEWDVIPYGNYTGPIGLFKDKYQPDLAAYYASRSHSSLPFGSGYKFVSSVSSLLVAKKK